MSDIEKNEDKLKDNTTEEPALDAEGISEIEVLRQELQEAKDKYLRLYAEMENYKKKTLKDKEELIKYSNESLLHELLPVLDSMEMALKHTSTASSEGSEALRQGVENTFRELQRTLEKFGLAPIDAEGREFDPSLHHAMSQVERADMEDNFVAEVFRKGYMLREKVLRPSLVVVSKKINQ